MPRYYLLDWRRDKPTGVIRWGQDHHFDWCGVGAGEWKRDDTLAHFVIGDDAGMVREVSEEEALGWTGQLVDGGGG